MLWAGKKIALDRQGRKEFRMTDLSTSQILDIIDQNQNVEPESLNQASERVYQDYLKDSKEYRESE